MQYLCGMVKFKPIKVPYEELNLSNKQKKTLQQISQELKIVKENIPIIKEVVARGGFILDTIMSAKPNDIDLFYSLNEWGKDEWQGCKCDEIKKKIAQLNLDLMGSRKVDLGHILEGEMYFDPILKIIGPFSHHIELPSRICVDMHGTIWSCKEAIYCIKNKVYETEWTGWLQHSYYPYTDDPYYRNFITSYARGLIRGLRMIHTKKYQKVGPNFRKLVEDSSPIFETVVKNPNYRSGIKKNISEKAGFMKINDFKKSLQVTKTKNADQILKRIEEITS